MLGVWLGNVVYDRGCVFCRHCRNGRQGGGMVADEEREGGRGEEGRDARKALDGVSVRIRDVFRERIEGVPDPGLAD